MRKWKAYENLFLSHRNFPVCISLSKNRESARRTLERMPRREEKEKQSFRGKKERDRASLHGSTFSLGISRGKCELLQKGDGGRQGLGEKGKSSRRGCCESSRPTLHMFLTQREAVCTAGIDRSRLVTISASNFVSSVSHVSVAMVMSEGRIRIMPRSTTQFSRGP